MTYTIKGRLSRGDETPRFTATLYSLGVKLATLQSDGQGGCARVRWELPREHPTRAAAVAWFASEASKIWARVCPDDAPITFGPHDVVEEASLMVVPEHLR